MAFFDKLNDFAKNIGDKTSDAIETTKLNSRISSERSAAGEDLKKIGEHYYNLFTAGGEVAPEVVEFCQSAKAHYDAANEAQAEIERIKMENEAEKVAAAAPIVPTAQVSGNACPSCGTVNSEGTKFCQDCGTKLEAPTPVPAENACPNCRAVNDTGVKFCRECGGRLEAPVPTEPEKHLCPACSTEVAPGVKFCPQCGQKMME